MKAAKPPLVTDLVISEYWQGFDAGIADIRRERAKKTCKRPRKVNWWQGYRDAWETKRACDNVTCSVAGHLPRKPK